MQNEANRFRHETPPGWNDIATPPRDGTVIEIQNNFGAEPSFGLYRWTPGWMPDGDGGWVDADDEARGLIDGPHLSWKPLEGAPPRPST